MSTALMLETSRHIVRDWGSDGSASPDPKDFWVFLCLAILFVVTILAYCYMAYVEGSLAA